MNETNVDRGSLLHRAKQTFEVPCTTALLMSGEDEAEIQRDIDTMVERLKLRRWTEGERKEYIAGQAEHPMFMDTLPTVRRMCQQGVVPACCHAALCGGVRRARPQRPMSTFKPWIR